MENHAKCVLYFSVECYIRVTYHVFKFFNIYWQKNASAFCFLLANHEIYLHLVNEQPENFQACLRIVRLTRVNFSKELYESFILDL